MRLFMLRFYFAKYLLFYLLPGVPALARSRTHPVIDSTRRHSSRSYVVLHDAPFPIHYVRAQALESGSNKKPISLEIYNLLVAGTTARTMGSSASVGESQNTVFEPGDTLLITLSVLPNADGIIE